MSNNILVAYFSATGTTEREAKYIAEAAKADLFEIVPEPLYSPADLNWNDKQSRSSKEMNDTSYFPPMKNKLANLHDYHTVFLGFPIWWYTAPTIIHTFLKDNDFAGKTIIPFATSGGSGFGNTIRNLKPYCTGNVKWEPGKMLTGANARTVAQWVGTLGLS